MAVAPRVSLNYPKAQNFAISSFDFNQLIEGLSLGTRGIETASLSFGYNTIGTPGSGKNRIVFDGGHLVQVAPAGTQTLVNGAVMDTNNPLMESRLLNPDWYYIGPLNTRIARLPMIQSVGTKVSIKGKIVAYGGNALNSAFERFGLGIVQAAQTAEPTFANIQTTFGNTTETTRDDMIATAVIVDATQNVFTYNNPSIGGDASYTAAGAAVSFITAGFSTFQSLGTDTAQCSWGSSSTAIWAGGLTGFYFYNGTTWVKTQTTGVGIYSMWGSAANAIWAGDSVGHLWFYNGTTWTDTFTTGVAQTSFSMWGTASNNIWAGVGTFLYKYNGTTWTQIQNLGTGVNANTIFGFSASSIFVGSSNGHFWSYNGSTFVDILNTSGNNILCMWGSSATAIWLGTGNGIYLYDGATLARSTFLPVSKSINAMMGTSSSNIFAVGSPITSNTQYAYYYNGTRWKVYQLIGNINQDLKTIWMIDANNMIAAGQNGLFYTNTVTNSEAFMTFEMILIYTSQSSLGIQLLLNGVSRLNITLNPGTNNIYPILMSNSVARIFNVVQLLEAI